MAHKNQCLGHKTSLWRPWELWAAVSQLDWESSKLKGWGGHHFLPHVCSRLHLLYPTLQFRGTAPAQSKLVNQAGTTASSYVAMFCTAPWLFPAHFPKHTSNFSSLHWWHSWRGLLYTYFTITDCTEDFLGQHCTWLFTASRMSPYLHVLTSSGNRYLVALWHFKRS